MAHYKGQVVTIYEDPITKTKCEGNARLVKKISTVDNLELWEVHFLDDDPETTLSRLL